MDISQYVLLAAVIAGMTEMIKRIRAMDYWTTATIATAAIIGGVFGAFGVEGLNIVTGIAAGFGTSGSLSVLGSIGNHSVPAPSTVIAK
jgi:hypothetical protein